jgi:hypothetical protein
LTNPLDDALRQLPQQEILALATAMYAIARAQVAAGKKLTPREQMILDEAAKVFPANILPNPSPRKPS